ncbi:MAG: DUF3330 domain-containing protein [Proteobacteria bacterium]|nr:DUF3330 domain-containing protein [Pseudomonadota bacterium]
MDKQLPEIELVSCDICLKEVPVSEATTPEAVDYVAHFCGLECYAKWRQGSESQPGEEAKK